MIGIVWLNKPLICIKNRVGGKMKILLVNKFHYLKGGSEKYYFTLAEAFKKMGHQVIFFAMQDEKNYPCETEKYFVSNVGKNGGLKSKLKLIKNMNYSKEAYKRMMMLLEKEKPDVAILNLVHKQITLSIIPALKKFNVKIIWTMHDLITVCPSYTMLDGQNKICEKCLKGNFSNCLKNKCIHGSTIMSYLSMKEAKYIRKHNYYNDVDLYICPSLFYKNKLLEGKFTNSKIIYLPNPLPIDTKYEFNSEVKDYILYFGRLSKEKGVDILIKAMKNIDYHLYVLGTGPIEQELKDLVKKEHLEKKVSLLGFKQGEELDKYIKNAKAVALPSIWYENGPYSAMEAMALGKPLIVSNYGGLPELVENGKNGFVFNNINELVNLINKIINFDSNSYDLMCKDSILRAKEKFNAENYVNKLLTLVEEI